MVGTVMVDIQDFGSYLKVCLIFPKSESKKSYEQFKSLFVAQAVITYRASGYYVGYKPII